MQLAVFSLLFLLSVSLGGAVPVSFVKAESGIYAAICETAVIRLPLRFPGWRKISSSSLLQKVMNEFDVWGHDSEPLESEYHTLTQ